MTIEQQKETSPKFREIEWVSKQVKEELKRFNKEKFYEKKGEEIVYNMETVKQYLGVLKDKKTWKELISKNSSAMIMAVQIALYSQNYSFGTIDGILGDKTKESIKKFQADNNLPVDTYGRSMPSTIQKLLEVISREDQVEIPQQEKKEAEEIMEEKENKDKSEGEDKKETNDSSEGINPNNKKKSDDDLNTQNEGQKPDNGLQQDNEIGDNVSNLEQDIIRPEIQELIDSYNGNSEYFKDVTELTKIESKAICDIRGIKHQYLYFSSLEKIHPSALEELMKHKTGMQLGLKTLSKEQAEKIEGFRHGINFNNLTILEPAIAQSLAKTGGKLEFSVIRQLSPEIMENFSGRESGDLIFEAVDTLDIKTAEKMVNIQYPGKIYLNGIKEISSDVAQILAQKPERFGLKNLDGTKPFSDEVLDALSKFPYLQLNSSVVNQIETYKKWKKIEGKQLTPPILELYNSGFRDMDSLKNITSLSYDDAVLLAQSGRSLDLSGIKEFAEDTFEALMKTKGNITLGLEKFPENLAEKVDGRSYGLEFKNLKTLDVNIAKHLAKCHGELNLNSLESITPEVAKELSVKSGSSISLNGIQKEDSQVFEAFNNYSGRVSFNNISEISEESAKVLEKKQIGLVYLYGLKDPLPDRLVPYLAVNISHISTNPESNIPIQLDKYLHPDKYNE